MLTLHTAALISGEIGAPIEDRFAALNFIAKSPEHAAAYATALLGDAMLGDVMFGPLPIIAKPKESDVKAFKARKEDEPTGPKAERTAGGVENISQMVREIYRLTTEFPAEMEFLAEENPSAFSPEVLTRLMGAASTYEGLQNVSSPSAQIQYVIDAEDAGTLPSGFVTTGRDRKRVTIKPIVAFASTVSPLVQRLVEFMDSSAFADAVKNTPESSASIDFHSEIVSFHDRYGQGRSLSDVKTLADQRRFDEARIALAKAKKFVLKQGVAALSNDGFDEMQNFDLVVDNLIAANDIRGAEAVLRHVEKWTLKMESLIKLMAEVSDKLTLVGEVRAKKDFENQAKKMLKSGYVDGLVKFMGDVREQIAYFETTAAVLKSRLSARVSTSLLFVLESARSLGALNDPSRRALLASRVPSVDVMLSPSEKAAEYRNVRMKMSALGLPVPGESGVPALGTTSAPGLSIEEAKKFKELPARTGQNPTTKK